MISSHNSNKLSSKKINSSPLRDALPVWVVPVVIGGCVLALALLVWRVGAHNSEVGPALKVHAGMYDIRQEIQKARAAKEQPGGTQSQ